MARWWDELPVPSLAEVTAMNERLAEPRRRLEDVLRDAVTRWPSSTSHFPRLVEVASWPAQDIRSAALAYHAWACESGRHGSMVVTAVLRQLLTWAEGWDRHELLLALYAAANAVTITQDSNHLETPVAIAARTDPDEWRELRPILERLFDWLETNHDLYLAGRSYLLSLLGEALDGHEKVPRSVLHRGDWFGPKARAELGDRLRAPGLGPLAAWSSTRSLALSADASSLRPLKMVHSGQPAYPCEPATAGI